MTAVFTMITGYPNAASSVWKKGSNERSGVCHGRVHRAGCANIKKERAAMLDEFTLAGSPEELADFAVGDHQEDGATLREAAGCLVICACCGSRGAWLEQVPNEVTR